ncbi:MAG: tRNA epoxyqueuosine(34) reductase QueG [Polyangiales bacterium]
MEPGDAGEAADALKAQLAARAKALGFHRMGVAAVAPLTVEAARLRAWLAAERHGAMAYMADTVDVRADVTHPGMLPSARSVVVLATGYARRALPVGPAPGRVARYAQGRDYHNLLSKRARKLADSLRAEGHLARAGVDSLPIFERAWAQRAGVGFIGKNCCLIVPGLGSHVLLTTLVTSAVLAPDALVKERCGACTACLTACPTDAFAAPRELDARRCIAYLTIEQRGDVPEPLRAGLGDWMFGCDACQDVCPFNRTAPPPEADTAPFAPDPRWAARDAEALLEMDDAAFAAYAHGSPIQRPGRAGMARNAALVLGNRGDKRHLPVLTRAAEAHDHDVVRRAAAWAVGAITARSDEAD